MKLVDTTAGDKFLRATNKLENAARVGNPHKVAEAREELVKMFVKAVLTDEYLVVYSD